MLKTFFSKNFFNNPPQFLVWGGLKTETDKFHEILTVFFLLHEHLQRKATFFYTPPTKFLVCGGSKNLNWQIFATFSKLQVV